ncbi:hypothetical protein FHG87_017224 [Trinorchestia longiramus]|nr:hypothetical protein FHG87_017224 [Trinorchestia longiramus]
MTSGLWTGGHFLMHIVRGFGQCKFQQFLHYDDRSLCWLFDYLNDLEGLLIETVDALHLLVLVSRWGC